MTRLEREKRTVETMILMYCSRHHRGAAVTPSMEGPCRSCAELLAYARKRVDACRFGAIKPVCAKCRVHCYKPDAKEAVRKVMRWAGPRMVFLHPLLALAHMVDGAGSDADRMA